MTRRSFIKRTGGATVATMIAWNLAVNEARADETNHPSDHAHSASHCPTHGVSCRWINSVAIELTGKMDPHPAPSDPHRSGAVFTGTLIYQIGYCNPDGTVGERDSDPVPVTSGGFLMDNDHLLQGVDNDTVVPRGSYQLSLYPDGKIPGFDLIPQPPHRDAVEIHDKQRQTNGSAGCIAFIDKKGTGGEWDKFNALMIGNRGTCPHSPPGTVPMTLKYTGVAPNTVWKPGHRDRPTCHRCKK